MMLMCLCSNYCLGVTFFYPMTWDVIYVIITILDSGYLMLDEKSKPFIIFLK